MILRQVSGNITVRVSKPWITYDYDKKNLTRIANQINKIDSFVIRKDNSFTMEKVDAPPVYLGFKDELKNIISMNFRIPMEIIKNGLSVNSIASFTVDKNGKMAEFQIEKTLSKEVDTNIFYALKKIEGEWSPAIFNGQPVDSQVFIVFDIKPEGATSTIPKIPNAIVIPFKYYGVTWTVQN